MDILIKGGRLLDPANDRDGLFDVRIRDGKIAEPLRVSVISGNVMETLHKIDGATKDAPICSSSSGGCGKMEQWPLRVAFGGPCIRVRDITVQ